MVLPQNFKALVVSETAPKQFVREIKQKPLGELPGNEVLIEVKYSSLNYKDALSAKGNKGVTLVGAEGPTSRATTAGAEATGDEEGDSTQVKELARQIYDAGRDRQRFISRFGPALGNRLRDR